MKNETLKVSVGKKKFFFKTLGCKMNFLDSAKTATALQLAGHSITESELDADVVVVNSCTVTAKAEKESQKEASTSQKKEKQVAVFGCSIRMHFDIWKEKYPEFLLFKTEDEFLKHFGADKNELDFPLHDRTRTPIAIQTGCDNACTFCITRLARGKTQDFSEESILRQVNRAVDAGVQEIVITGIQLASWGCGDSAKYPERSRLGVLLQSILDNTQIRRIRLSSIGPQFLNDAFWNVYQNPRICDHLHLSIQSGSAAVLQKMNRGHGIREVYEIFEKARTIRPNTGFSADFIVGFPGETVEDFEMTKDLITKGQLVHCHIFPYSERKGTAAVFQKGVVPIAERKDRAKHLREHAEKVRKAFIASQLGKEFEVLVEHAGTGLTTNYISIKMEDAPHNSVQKIVLSIENIVSV